MLLSILHVKGPKFSWVSWKWRDWKLRFCTVVVMVTMGITNPALHVLLPIVKQAWKAWK
jgi:hypothetical protein